jgi:C1A family cysteine protease
MKSIVAVLLLAALASASSIDTFRQWSLVHNKVYTGKEEARRFAIFKENLAKIERLNLDESSARFAPNKFSDLTEEEFKVMYVNGLKSTKKTLGANLMVKADGVTASADYRDRLPMVKDQAQCGSCWAFSAIANMEGQLYMNNGKVVTALSEQQLVSCDKSNSGCNGGLMTAADAYACKNAITTSELYPYTSGKGVVSKCKNPIPEGVHKFSTYMEWDSISSDATFMGYLDKYGPLSVGIAAGTYYFQSYAGGVLTDSKACGKDLDHGVALVGYGTESGSDYWLVRNSWGPGWGESGYVKLARGINMCSINEMVSSIVY